MSNDPAARLPIHTITVLGARGPAWHLTVACPEKDHTVDADTCASCRKLRELLPPDEEGRSYILCEPRRSTHDATTFASARVADLMTRDILCAHEDLRAAELLRLLTKEGLECAPVVDERGLLQGIASRADVTRVEGNAAVARVMDATIALHENARLPEAAKAMAHAHVHTAAVLSDDKKIVGVISALDVLRWLTRETPAL